MAAGLPTSFAAFHAESETLLTDLRSIMAVSSQVRAVCRHTSRAATVFLRRSYGPGPPPEARRRLRLSGAPPSSFVSLTCASSLHNQPSAEMRPALEAIQSRIAELEARASGVASHLQEERRALYELSDAHDPGLAASLST